jgi:hypothetical protein
MCHQHTCGSTCDARRRRRTSQGLIVALLAVLAGCGTTEEEGRVGDTLSSRTLDVTLQRAGWAQDGGYGVRVKLCRDEPGQAINSFAFTLVLADEREADPDALRTTFGVSRAEGCEAGAIVFPVARERDVDHLRFDYDDTGSQQPGDREEHATFTWRLP